VGQGVSPAERESVWAMNKWIRRHKYLMGAVLVLLALGVGGALRGRHPEVEVTSAATGALTLPLAASGLVEGKSADLGFLSAGRIAEIYVREGEAVTQSQLLARLMPVATPGEGSGVGDVIQAPYHGNVVTIYERQGAAVSPGQPVLRVTAAGAPWVTAFVEAEEAAYLHRGHRLQCGAGGYLSQAWELQVEEVGKEAVPRPDLPGSSSQVRVRCRVMSPAFPLAPGATVDVDAEIPLLDDVLLIPAAAVTHEDARDRVWVAEEGRVRRREIEVGPNNFDLVQVRRGLAAGEVVVVHGKDDLTEGQRVRTRLMPPMTPAARGGL